MTIYQILKHKIKDFKKFPTTSAVKGLFMDIRDAFDNGMITPKEREKLIKELNKL